MEMQNILAEKQKAIRIEEQRIRAEQESAKKDEYCAQKQREAMKTRKNETQVVPVPRIQQDLATRAAMSSDNVSTMVAFRSLEPGLDQV